MKRPGLFSLILFTGFATILAVVFTPAFPEIAKQLQISTSMTQLTMTLFLLGYALGNIPYGPLSNRYGRKPTLFIGLIITLIGCLMVVIVPTMPSLLLFMAGRFLMGLGSCVGIKIATTMIGDTYEEDEARKITPYIVLSFAIIPGVAIFIGGLLTQYWGWQSCLYFMAFYTVFQLLMIFPLPETLKKRDPHALNWNHVIKKYVEKTKNKTVILCSLILGFGTSFVYLFASEAPFIGIDHLKLSPEQFGTWNFIPSIGMALGALLTRFLVGKFPALNVLKWGAIIIFIGGLAMARLFVANYISLYTLFLPTAIILFGLSMVLSNAMPIAMAHAKDKGTASAVLNFLNMIVSVILLSVMGLFSNRELMTMPVIFAISGIILLFLYFRLAKK